MFRVLLLSAVLVAAALPASARQRPEGDPGYVDPTRIEELVRSEATLEVNLSGSLLRMVAEAAREDDRGLYDLLSKIRGLYVRGYTLTGDDAAAISARFNDVARSLSASGWERVVRVREGDETVHVLVKALDDRIQGLAVLVSSPGENETVFVNIVGEIRPEEIGRIGRRFRIEAIDNL